MEIAGPQANDLADKLSARLKEAVGAEATVSRPVRRGLLRVTGLDESACTTEIVEAVATLGNCSPKEIGTGSMRPMGNGSKSILVRCPITAAQRVASIGRIKAGWTMASVILLDRRLTLCFRCWRSGHTQHFCSEKSGADLLRCCFRCGEMDHVARACTNKPRCIVCAGQNLSHDQV